MNGFIPIDVAKRRSDRDAFSRPSKEQFGKIDFLVHSLAFADRTYLKKEYGNFTSTPRQRFRAGPGYQRLQPARPDARRRCR